MLHANKLQDMLLAATGMHSSRTDMLSRAAKLAGNVFPTPLLERVKALIWPSTVKSCANFGCTAQQGDCSLAVHVCCLFMCFSDVICALADAVATCLCCYGGCSYTGAAHRENGSSLK